MIEDYSKVKTACLIFAICLVFLYVRKPSLMFEEYTQRPRQFGLGFNRDRERRTLFSLSVTVVPIAALAWVIAEDS